MGNVVTPECGAERRRRTCVLWGAGLAIALAVGCASGKPVRVAEAPAAGTAEAAVETGATPAGGETAPITIRSLDIAEGAPEAFLNLEASGPVVWTSYRDPEGRVVLELPNAVPAAGLADLSPVEGLVQGVAIERGQEGNRPLTRLVVATRQQVEHGVTADGPRLQLRLMPVEEETVAAVPPPAEPPATPAITYEPVPESETAAEPQAESPAPETAAEPTADEVAAEMAAESGLPGTAEAPAVAPAPRGAAATRLDGVETLQRRRRRHRGAAHGGRRVPLLDLPARRAEPLRHRSVGSDQPEPAQLAARSPRARSNGCGWPSTSRCRGRCRAWSSTWRPAWCRASSAPAKRWSCASARPLRSRWRAPPAVAPPPPLAAERPLERPAPFQTAAAQAPQVEIEEEDTPPETIRPTAPPPPRGPSQVEVTRRPEAIEPPVASEPGLVTARPPAETFSAQAVGETERVYSGEPIDLKVTNAEVNDVLRTFAQLSGLNIIVQPGVTGMVTAEMENVPWDQALEQILRINGLGYEVEGNVMRIAPVAVLRQEARDRQDLAQARALAIPLRTVIKRLSYADAQAVAALLRSGAAGGLLSQRGNVIVDLRTNTLIIKELPAFLDTVLKVIENLDIPEPQVMIEARIVETTKSFTRSLGIDWGFDGVASAATGNTTGVVFPNNVAVGGNVNLGAGGSNGLLNVRLGNILNTFTLDAVLDAAESEGLINILSAPKVATLNNQAASIQSGLQIPIQTIANNTVTVQFVNATLSLDVTPHVTAEGTILMDIDIRKREPQLGLVVPGATNAPISTKEASTRVIVRDGGTTVIGGIYKLSSDEGEDRIPGLANIPILGYLFRNRTRRDENEELLIFITPRVMKL